ncbi:metallophosphoesterase [Candidatus Micrarchaeota archaeon]|nr:metallophosphoesterase [Candidatus Micrarchaeota archaeon]
MKFLTNEPAGLVGSTLVISDVHVGLEYDLRAHGMNVPSQTGKLAKLATRLVRENKADRVAVLGDLKHSIIGTSWPEKHEVKQFIEAIRAAGAEVMLIKGNHDAWIERFSDITLAPAQGTRVRDSWLAHGHARPPVEAFECEEIVFGHAHPTVVFEDSLGGKRSERAWLRFEQNKPPLVIVPAFNPLLGGADARDVRFAWVRGPPSAYLLDGTPLGKIRQKKAKSKTS